MAGKEAKIATVIMKVDLECCCCSKKIKRSLCKLQKRFKITSIVFDEKKHTVIVSGPFNPDCFIKKLCCMAYKVIKDIEIKKPDPPPLPPPKEMPKPDPLPPKPSSQPLPKPPPPASKPSPKPQPPESKPPPPAPKPEKPKPQPSESKPPPPKLEPAPPPPEEVVRFPIWAFPVPIGPCCYQPCPCYEPHHGCCRCCS